MNLRWPALLTALCLICPLLRAEEPKAPDYNTQVAPILRTYCEGCHDAETAEGKFVLDSFQGLLKGGEHGTAILPGNSAESPLIRMVERSLEPFMPPEGSEAPTADEIAVLKAWIDSGAKGPDGQAPQPSLLNIPKIEPAGDVRQPVHAVAASRDGTWIAVARYGNVEIRASAEAQPLRVLPGHAGHVNDLGVSADGTLLFAASGEPGLFGEVRLWGTADWTEQKLLRGHRDSVTAAALSADGALLATGSYDKQIVLWDVASGKELRTLSGHNDAIFDLAFHPSGKLLASASGDSTVKLWDVSTGERLDTLGQPTKEQYTVAFSPDGRFVVAGGVDNRIRVWEIQAMGREGTNPLLFARFGHEAPILKLLFTADGRLLVSSSEDKTLKLWEGETFTQLRTFERQSDWPTALSVAAEGKQLIVGRLDGSLQEYPLDGSVRKPAEAKPIAAAAVVPSTVAADAAMTETEEAEPNGTPETATSLPVPGHAKGVLHSADGGEDVDLYRFESKAGQVWIVETKAARDKSPADTKIQVLDNTGEPVVRLLLQAVRDSWINFRPIDSTSPDVRVENWEEMDLDQFMYISGEVCKTYRMPQGPDSGFRFYDMDGKRICYFDTSGLAHAIDEPVYIVEPYAQGTELVDNGLPVFPLHFENDDDGQRELGSDSRLTFTAPADGHYLVRVSDVRGLNGDSYKYQLTVRPARPDFTVAIEGKSPKIGAGSGQRLRFKLDRIDDFDGDVRIELAGLPDGFSASSPIVVQAGHLFADGVINAARDAVQPSQEAWEQVKVTASAEIAGSTVTKDLGHLGEIKLEPQPKVIVILEPDSGSGSNGSHELVIAPGSKISAMLRIERAADFNGELKFDVNNLPHGVIVDNLGLNGIMIREGETSRQIFLSASPWVPETTRFIHAAAQGQGNQASLPILLRVKSTNDVAATE